MSAPSFVLQQSGTQQALNHVYGFGPTLVVAVGNSGTILVWNGQKWVRRESGTAQNLTRVWGATSGSTGAAFWAIGPSVLLYSGDGAGQSWQPVVTLTQAINAYNVAQNPADTVPNVGAIWGPSPSDFWAIDNVFGSFWHTTNGGAGWTSPVNFTVGVPKWLKMWGDGPSIIAPAVGIYNSPPAIDAYYDGATNGVTAGPWVTAGRLGDPIGTVLDGWPHAGSTQAWLVGWSPTGARGVATGGQISDWNINLSSPSRTLDAVPSGALQYNAVYGADLANLYAAGVGYSGQPFLVRIAPPALSYGATSSWNPVALPAGLPLGGLNAVYAGPSGYAVTVGAGGGIAATPGYVLAVQQAIAVATNTVQATLTNIPLTQSPIGVGDALNPASWAITRSDTGAALTILAVVQISPLVFNIVVAERLAAASVTHTLTAALIDPFGNTIAGPTSAAFPGVLADAVATSDAAAAANNYVLSDIANPAAPTVGQGAAGGVRIITASGDYAGQTGNQLLLKLILRRISTATNGFFHLPGYGLGLDPKAPLRSSDLVALKKRIEDQVALEPEVVAVQVTLTLDPSRGILFIQGLAATTLGERLPFQTQVQTPLAGA